MAACVSSSNRADFSDTDISVGATDLRVWVADEPDERSQGLKEITRLPADIDGLLFVFPGPAVPTFVMDETRFPLDLWFFDEDGALIGMEEMEPCSTDPCPGYPAPDEVSWALETPLGVYGFEAGDTLSTSDSG